MITEILLENLNSSLLINMHEEEKIQSNLCVYLVCLVIQFF